MDGQIKELFRTGLSTVQDVILRNQKMGDLRKMMKETNAPQFNLRMAEFILKYKDQEAFIKYLASNYINNGWFKHWSAAFQPQHYTNMETNNYV
jgi:hypothetical protein